MESKEEIFKRCVLESVPQGMSFDEESYDLWMNSQRGKDESKAAFKAMESYSAQYREENERLKAAVSASERFRAEDGMSAINEQNRLRECIAELEAELAALRGQKTFPDNEAKELEMNKFLANFTSDNKQGKQGFKAGWLCCYDWLQRGKRLRCGD